MFDTLHGHEDIGLQPLQAKPEIGPLLDVMSAICQSRVVSSLSQAGNIDFIHSVFRATFAVPL